MKICCRTFVSFLFVVVLSEQVCLLRAQAAPPATVTVVVDTDHPGAKIPDDFSGLSFETESLLADKAGSHYFSETNNALVETVRNLGVRSLRIGGNTADRPTLPFPDAKDVDSLFAFAKLTSANVIFTLRLRQGGPQDAAPITKYLIQRYGSQLTCLEIGNEPNVYLKSFPAYHAELKRYMEAFESFSSGTEVHLCGPGTTPSNPDWARDFAGAFSHSDQIRFVTQHAYPGNSGRKVLDPMAGISAMLSRAWVTSYERFYESFATVARANQMPFRIDETNSYFNGGARNVSNTFASSLWGLDYMYWWASHDAAGINFHTGEHVAAADENTECFYAVFLRSHDGYAIQPLGYAMKAFDIAGHGRIVPLHLEFSADPPNLTAYAVTNDRELYVTVINKEETSTKNNAAVTIAVPAKYHNVSSIRLESLKGGVAARSGVTLGGVAIQENGVWDGKWQKADANSNQKGPRIAVPAGSAAILRFMLASRAGATRKKRASESAAGTPLLSGVTSNK